QNLFENVDEGQLEASSEMIDLLFACHDRLAQMVEQVATQKPCPADKELKQQVQAILRGESLPDFGSSDDLRPTDVEPEADQEEPGIDAGELEEYPEIPVEDDSSLADTLHEAARSEERRVGKKR